MYATYLNNAEQCRHRLEIVIWWGTCEQLNYSATNTPDIRSSTNTRHFDDLIQSCIGNMMNEVQKVRNIVQMHFYRCVERPQKP